MTKAEKQKCILKLMVIALNKAISAGVIDLNGKSGEINKRGHIETDIGGLPTVINWFDAGYDELRVTVWWDYRPDLMPTWRKKHIGRLAPGTVPNVARRFFGYILGACGSCYLERKTGKFIVGEAGNQFFDLYVREHSVYDLNSIVSEQPAGYETSGRTRE
ncbi:Uncharacterised protein [Serratia plymuthica]|nr:Uncharacterised protein [Serratia plymuthica]